MVTLCCAIKRWETGLFQDKKIREQDIKGILLKKYGTSALPCLSGENWAGWSSH